MVDSQLPAQGSAKRVGHQSIVAECPCSCHALLQQVLIEAVLQLVSASRTRGSWGQIASEGDTTKRAQTAPPTASDAATCARMAEFRPPEPGDRVSRYK